MRNKDRLKFFNLNYNHETLQHNVDNWMNDNPNIVLLSVEVVGTTLMLWYQVEDSDGE